MLPKYNSADAETFLQALEAFLEASPHETHSDLQECRTVLEDGQEQDTVKVAELLGTAAGRDERWRDLFRENGLLKDALDGISKMHETESYAQDFLALAKQYLRVIGNCVVDNDESRKIVQSGFIDIIACLALEPLATTAVVVILNLCNDFEPAQVQAASLRLDVSLVDRLTMGQIPDEAIDYAIEPLTWTLEHLTPIQLRDATSFATFTKALDLALRYEEDHLEDFAVVLNSYLMDEEFQKLVASSDLLEKLINITALYESRLDAEDLAMALTVVGIRKDNENAPTAEFSVLLLTQLINALSLISATDEFAAKYTYTSPLVDTIRSKLLAATDKPTAVAGCTMLGNLVCSNESAISMVKDKAMHIPLLSVLSSATEPALLYAAAGSMRQLSIPEENKTLLGEAGLITTCCRLLSQDDPSVRGEAAATLHRLVSNNRRNIEHVVYEHVPEETSFNQQESQDAGAPTAAQSQTETKPTLLSFLVSQALAPSGSVPSTSMKNALLELPRAIIAILRYIRQPSTDANTSTLDQDILKTPLLARPIARLVRQRFFADARSEGLLGLGLLAQTQEGAAMVVEEMREDRALLEGIKECAGEAKEGEEGKGDVGLGRDRQNAIVLVHALERNGVDVMDEGLKSEIKTLQDDLGKLSV